MNAISQRIRALLHELGYRVTPQRLAIATHLLADTEHPTATQIWSRVRHAYPTMSLMTVYQTLRLLEEVGELHKFHDGSGEAHWEASNQEPHAHRICRCCGAISDIDLSPLALDDHGWVIQRCNVQLLGICPECRQETGTDDRVVVRDPDSAA